MVFWDSEAAANPISEHPRDAVAATERFRKAIAGHNWQDGCKIKGELSISGGIASFPWDADTVETLLEKADGALLRAKGQGKNVILLHAAREKLPAVAAVEAEGDARDARDETRPSEMGERN